MTVINQEPNYTDGLYIVFNLTVSIVLIVRLNAKINLSVLRLMFYMAFHRIF